MNYQLVTIQILRWLMKPKVWRFVGFASAVVGLLCYGLSSSFNHLFGDWNFLKICVYSIFSLIMSLMILYAHIWKHSRSLRFKAHLSFLVLTITSIFSFFSDKVMNGKPDAYSLISCVAFAIMSLNLSKQTQCGFEVDLLYFFLGCLIVQLMKIKLQLAIAGTGFSYFLILLRSFSSMDDPPNDEHVRLLDEHSVVIEVDSRQASVDGISGMMQQLRTCIKELDQENSNLMNMLTKKMKEHKVVTDHNYVLDALPSGRVNELREIFKLMVSAGYEKQFCDVYSSWRKEFLNECLINKLFGLGGINLKNELEGRWRLYSDIMMKRWVKASEVAFRILFPSERRLCDHVFSDFSSTADQSFIEVCLGFASQLLNFTDAVVDGSPSVSRLFTMLKMFKALRDLIPELQSLFPNGLVNEAMAVTNRLGEASSNLLMELDKLIFRVSLANQDASATADRKHHPMTAQVMSYLHQACTSRRTQEQILQEFPRGSANGVGTCSFKAQMERILKLLERKLVDKSKIYEDPASRYLFMMNNRSKIAAVSEGWEMENFFGNDWFRKNREKVEQNIELYKGSSWNKVLELLKLDNNQLMASYDDAAELLKDKLSLFNMRFEEMSSVQASWRVDNKRLKEEIITSLQNTLLPAYGIFIGRFQDVLGKNADEYIQYGIFDIEDRLNNLFLQSY